MPTETHDEKRTAIVQPGFDNHVSLAVDGHPTPADAEYVVRFVQQPHGPATPVLYHRGRRVIKAWTLEIFHSEPADRWGCSG